MNSNMAEDITQRIPEMIGRQEHMKLLRSKLHQRGESHFVYFWAYGGLGKTRLLEELQKSVRSSGPGFYTTGIIDLYHTDTHSSSDVERAIVEALDPGQQYFAAYRRERKHYEHLRELGADPQPLENLRKNLSELFIKDCREMALEARKLVICFDTIELLQYESSIVEEKIGLETTADTLLRSWLLDKLPRLANVLVVFAGRPKLQSPDENVNHQKRLIDDMERAFAPNLQVVELKPLSRQETDEFIHTLSGHEEVIPSAYLPIVHQLTGGRPIYIHLMVDLLRTLSREPAVILAMFDEYSDLVDAPDDDPRLLAAQRQIQVEILRSIYNNAGTFGGYLGRFALMPKGVDAEILQHALGLPQDEAATLLNQLEPLSFVKRFKAAPGAERLHGKRFFLHDEMYQLLTSEIMPHLRMNEVQVAKGLIDNYYTPLIEKLEMIIRSLPTDERIMQRERLQKFQVERLFYTLVRDPRQGYEEYKLLSEQANGHRWVGFGMRLRDEFLRFYNTPDRRSQFLAARVTHEQVVRESVQMWVERFHWWARYDQEIDFARKILDDPEHFQVHPKEDTAILGNVCALWGRARAMKYGFEPAVTQEARSMWEKLPPLDDCTTEEMLARGRLSTTIGYQHRWGGLLGQAALEYAEAAAAFRKLRNHPEELIIVLNNLAYVYAKQGRIPLARIRGIDALKLNDLAGNEYSKALTLSNLAYVERIAGDYDKAIRYGGEALDLFKKLDDKQGQVRAALHIAYAKRKMAKGDLEQGPREETVRSLLDEAREILEGALQAAGEAGLRAEEPELNSELGNVYRELGRAIAQTEDSSKAVMYFHEGEQRLETALKWEKWGPADHANVLQDLAELYYRWLNPREAQNKLFEVETRVGPQFRLSPGQDVSSKDLPSEHFWPLGKVERLRGDMDSAAGKLTEALQHYVMAYAYFERFSVDAVDKDSMLMPLNNQLQRFPVDEQQHALKELRSWVQEFGGTVSGVNVSRFMDILDQLIGNPA